MNAYTQPNPVAAGEQMLTSSHLLVAELPSPVPSVLSYQHGRPAPARVVLSDAHLAKLRGQLEADEYGRIACPIPGHTGSARIDVPPDPRAGGEARLLCCTGRWRSLGEMIAAIAYGHDERRGTTELAMWTRRLGYDLGAFVPAPVQVPTIPDDLTEQARDALCGFLLLVGLRWRDGERRPVAFSVTFAEAWCGLSHGAAQRALSELRACRAMVEVGRYGRTPLYLPSPVQTERSREGKRQGKATGCPV